MEDNVRKKIMTQVYNLGHFTVQQKMTEHYKSTVIKEIYKKKKKLKLACFVPVFNKRGEKEAKRETNYQ